jgi:hypothetical protein
VTAPVAGMHTDSAPVNGVSLGALWFGLLAAPFAWSDQLMVDYALIAHTCFPATSMLDMPYLPSARAIVLGVSVLDIVVGIAGIVVAARAYARLGGDHESDRRQFHDAPIAEGRARFMALAGILASSLFLGGIVLHTIGIVMLAPCV